MSSQHLNGQASGKSVLFLHAISGNFYALGEKQFNFNYNLDLIFRREIFNL